MFKFLYFKSVTNVAFSPLIVKAEGYKKRFTLREHPALAICKHKVLGNLFFILLLLHEMVLIGYITNGQEIHFGPFLC